MVVFHCPQSVVEVAGVGVNIGSRDEAPSQFGLAHFVEHTLFKGTSAHKAAYINSRMEVVGGELNAYTTKEETMLYTVAPSGTASRALPLLAELVCDSAFPEVEVGREREVVLDEIASYLDSAAEAVVDDFDDLIYAGSGPGHNILGYTESVSKLSADDCRQWVERWFTPRQMLAFYYGPEKPERIFALTGKHLASLSRPDSPRNRVMPEMMSRFSRESHCNRHQAHTVMGVRIPSLNSPEQPVYALMLNILGGPGANSLLNVDLREKRGLVYTVDASRALLTDAGLAVIYFGCDLEDTSLCRRRVEAVVRRLAETPLSDRVLKRAKEQLFGQVTVASVNPVEEVLGRARRILHGSDPSALTFARFRTEIEQVSTGQVSAAAARLMECSSLTLN